MPKPEAPKYSRSQLVRMRFGRLSDRARTIVEVQEEERGFLYRLDNGSLVTEFEIQPIRARAN